MHLPVIFEDNHLLVVDKPAGLLAQGDRSGDITLVDVAGAYLKEKYAKPGNVYVGLVHRLDRNVSGVVVLARTSKAAARLSAQFRTGTVHKTYQAIVDGVPQPLADEMVSWLAPAGNRQGVTRAAVDAFSGAKESRLYYSVVAQQQGFAQVKVEPVTGRRHQIRAQMALLGCPLVGDVKYGSLWRLPDHRLALHAAGLSFHHPVGGRELKFEAPLPGDWPWPVPANLARKT